MNNLITIKRVKFGNNFSKIQPWHLKVLRRLPVNTEFIVEQLSENPELEFQFQYEYK